MIKINFNEAYLLAVKMHNGQIRKKSGLDYVTHPLAVSDKFEDTFLKVIAVLHDVEEDCDVSFFDLYHDYGVPLKVIEKLSLLTKPKGVSYLKYILRVKTDEIATKVKIEDLKHNLIDPLSKCQEDKYLMALYILETKI